MVLHRNLYQLLFSGAEIRHMPPRFESKVLRVNGEPHYSEPIIRVACDETPGHLLHSERECHITKAARNRLICCSQSGTTAGASVFHIRDRNSRETHPSQHFIARHGTSENCPTISRADLLPPQTCVTNRIYDGFATNLDHVLITKAPERVEADAEDINFSHGRLVPALLLFDSSDCKSPSTGLNL